MERKAVFGVIPALLLTSMLTLVFNVQAVEITGPIYIRADGSIDPSSAPILQNGNLYTLTDNITILGGSDGIVIERDNITFDGAGCALRGEGMYGIRMFGGENVTIENTRIGGFDYGIWLNLLKGIIIGNSVENTSVGIYLSGSSGNNIVGNHIRANSVTSSLASSTTGIWLYTSENNSISGNSVTDSWNGILFDSLATNNVLRSNSVTNNTRNFQIPSWASGINDVDTSNTVDGKPIYYWVDEQNTVVPVNAGDVILVNCINITIQNLNLTSKGTGIQLINTTNSSMTENSIRNSLIGIDLEQVSYDNSMIRNNVKACSLAGIELGSYNILSENRIEDNYQGLLVLGSFNHIYHNNFINDGASATYKYSSNVWDSGYPSGGNYWSGFSNVDIKTGPSQGELGSDGISDDRMYITTYFETNVDRYPLAGPFNTFDGAFNGKTYDVDVVSNSTASDFYINPQEGAFISFNVTGAGGTTGFSRVAIPKQLLWVKPPAQWVVLVAGTAVTPTVIEDADCTYLYFTYTHSTKIVRIIGTNMVPEFPSTVILPLFMLLSTVGITFATRRLLRKPRSNKTSFLSGYFCDS